MVQMRWIFRILEAELCFLCHELVLLVRFGRLFVVGVSRRHEVVAVGFGGLIHVRMHLNNYMSASPILFSRPESDKRYPIDRYKDEKYITIYHCQSSFQDFGEDSAGAMTTGTLEGSPSARCFR